jgi:flap endonuclease-1
MLIRRFETKLGNSASNRRFCSLLQLAKRSTAKAKAEKDLEAAKEAGDVEDMERFAKRTVKMDKTHIDDCKRLLTLMGMPVVEAPCEAEAQCAALAKAGKVYAAASEDMDTMTFGAPRLVRRLWASESGGKVPILEFNLEKTLSGLDVTMDQFVDTCILAGCDYCPPIKGESR